MTWHSDPSKTAEHQIWRLPLQGELLGDWAYDAQVSSIQNLYAKSKLPQSDAAERIEKRERHDFLREGIEKIKTGIMISEVDKFFLMVEKSAVLLAAMLAGSFVLLAAGNYTNIENLFDRDRKYHESINGITPLKTFIFAYIFGTFLIYLYIRMTGEGGIFRYIFGGFAWGAPLILSTQLVSLNIISSPL